MAVHAFSRRRWLLGGLASASSLFAIGRGARVDAPAVEFPDPLTERKMERLTDPAHLFRLPHRSERFLADHNDALYLAGELDGSRQVFEYDLKRQRLVQLSEGPGLLSDSITLDHRNRNLFYLQGDRLVEGGRGDRTVQTIAAGWRATGALTLSDDGALAAWIEMREGDEHDDPAQQFARHPRCRLQAAALSGGAARTLVEEDHWLDMPRFRPGSHEILYAREGPWGEVAGRLQLISADGGASRSLRERIGEEQIGAEQWSSDGERIWFVHFPDKGYRGATIRTLDAAGANETTVSPCSAFGWFHVNHDASAIVGASRRPSGPNIYVLFPKLQREITLCEHGASGKPHPIAGTDRMDPQASAPAPVLSHDSQWVYFSSDREGKPAVYRMKVEDLVSET
ncbi:MAG: hypothetical protein GC160_15095 [Acidobacteria bacterium]|nr:hypothetical protein [Acidobacteriota bacterium]